MNNFYVVDRNAMREIRTYPQQLFRRCYDNYYPNIFSLQQKQQTGGVYHITTIPLVLDQCWCLQCFDFFYSTELCCSLQLCHMRVITTQITWFCNGLIGEQQRKHHSSVSWHLYAAGHATKGLSFNKFSYHLTNTPNVLNSRTLLELFEYSPQLCCCSTHRWAGNTPLCMGG